MNNNTQTSPIMRAIAIILALLMAVPMLCLFVSAPGCEDEIETPTTEVTIEETTEGTTAETEPELINEPVLYPDVKYEKHTTKWGAVDHKDAIDFYINELNTSYNSGLYTEEAKSLMWDEIGRLEVDARLLQVDIDMFTRWDEEHYYASQTWQYLRSKGFSEEVTAGIIGNMMVETAGGTLDLKPTIYDYSNAFYGLCQWSLYYRPNVRDMAFEDQLDYLYNDISKEFDNFGFCYRSGFTYEDFLVMSNPGDAALAFAKVYERCGSGSYSWRQWAAGVAYKYFTGEE